MNDERISVNHRLFRSILTAICLGAITVACGTGSSTLETPTNTSLADVPAPESSAPENTFNADHPANRASVPTSVAPDIAYPTDTNPIDVEDGSYTLRELVQQSTSIVVGNVAGAVSLGRPDSAEDPYADEFIGFTVTVESTLLGDQLSEVTIAWPAINTDKRGERVRTWIRNGLRPPQVGDQLLLFVRTADPQTAAHLSEFPSHAPVGLDGMAFVSADGIVSEVEVGSPAGHQLLGMTTQEVSAAIDSLTRQ